MSSIKHRDQQMSYKSRTTPHHVTVLKIQILFLSILVFVFFNCEKPAPHKKYFPETGKHALYQRALDLKSNLNVLSIATQPGKEDLAALAYFRMAKGATIMSAYVTNGEAGESDIRAEYPPYLAGILRSEASKAMEFLDGEAHFLNMPDIGSARDTMKVRNLWQPDTLQVRLSRLITTFKPDIILVAPHGASEDENPLLKVLYATLKKAVIKVSTKPDDENLSRLDLDNYWDVDRVFAADFGANDFTIPYEIKHPRWKKSYRAIGQEAALQYPSLKFQQKINSKRGSLSYRLIYSINEQKMNEMDDGMSGLWLPRFRSLEQKINELSDKIVKGKTGDALTRLVTIKDSVNTLLVQRQKMHPGEREALFDWNLGLENLHCSLLGVKVKFSISDTRLTARQITYLTIDEVAGMQEEGNTEIFFSGTAQGWIINEYIERRLPLKLHEKYRLVSPEMVNFNFPYGHQRIQSATEGFPYFFFIIHRASSREKSFVYRARVDFSFGPRFVTEVLTPIVRMVEGEGVAIRLTNISRDGVKDQVWIEHELASSPQSTFRLNVKDSTFIDTLRIQWRGDPVEDTYLIPITIGGMRAANFVARKFSVDIDQSKKVGIIKGFGHSMIEDALRRLSVKFSLVNLHQKFSQQVDTLDVLLLDQRVVTLKPEIIGFKNQLDKFVEKGGHLIILAQDAISWNETPLWSGLQLNSTAKLDETIPLELDSTHKFLTSPNVISVDDWNGWLFRRGYNVVSATTVEEAELPVKVKESGVPLIVSQTEGNGRRTYIDLALDHQLMNIHPGAFRLLANLISY